MNRTYFLLIFTFLRLVGISQESVTLELCRERAQENYPLSKQNEFLPASHDLKIKNLNKNFFPQMSINGQAHYQSDVTKTPVNVPGISIPVVSKDQYKLYLDVNQTIYDGWSTNRQKALEDVNLKIDMQNICIDLFKLKERVNQIYFSILLLKEKAIILELHRATLSSKLADVESGVRNGILLTSNLYILQAELIKADQALTENRISLGASLSMMNEFTGLSLNESTDFVIPVITVDLGRFTNNRPEFLLFSLQQEKISASKKLSGSTLLPRLSAFGQAGYGDRKSVV